MDLTADRSRLDLYALLEAFAAGTPRGPLPDPADPPARVTGLQRTAMTAAAAGLAAVVIASLATIWTLVAIANGTVGWAQPATAAIAALVAALALFGADKAFTAVRGRLTDAAAPTVMIVTTEPIA